MPDLGSWYQRVERAQPNPEELRAIAAEARRTGSLKGEEVDLIVGRCAEYLSDHFRAAGQEVPEDPTDPVVALP